MPTQSVPQMDDQLDELGVLIHNVEQCAKLSPQHSEAARSALRSYLSEDTRRLDWLATNCLEASAADTYLRLEYESGLPLRDAIDRER